MSTVGSNQSKTIIKILLLGDGAVGKTSLRKEYTGEGYRQKYSMTMGAEFSILRAEGSIIQIYDLAGQSNFKPVRSNYYKGSQGAILVFDVTKKSSFKSLDAWIQELNIQVEKDIPLIVVGNKIDLRDDAVEEVSSNDVRAWIDHLELSYDAPILYLETSVVNQYQVFDVFKNLISMISGEILGEIKDSTRFGHITTSEQTEELAANQTVDQSSSQSSSTTDQINEVSGKDVEIDGTEQSEDFSLDHKSQEKIPVPKGKEELDGNGQSDSKSVNEASRSQKDSQELISSTPDVMANVDREKAKRMITEMFDSNRQNSKRSTTDRSDEKEHNQFSEKSSQGRLRENNLRKKRSKRNKSKSRKSYRMFKKGL